MPDVSDMDLLRDYSQHGSESPFAKLVQRHINLVYSVALRHVGITAHAEEITQAVFIILARKAASLRRDTILEGWLYETTRLTALSFMRGERRRQSREQEAYMQSTLNEPDTNVAVWNQLAPLLDEAMARLAKKDRDAVVLRFFKDKSVREVATGLQISEAAAQRRILRALEKLHRFFTKRGASSTAATMAGVIAANSVQAAPVALTQSVTAVALAKGTTVSISTLTLIKGALKIMAWTKVKTVMVIGAVVVLAAGTTTLAVKHQHQANEPVPQNAWAFKGYANPEATFQSALWAMSHGDIKTLTACYTPEFGNQFMETAGKGKSDNELAAMFTQIAGMIEDFQAVSKEATSSDGIILHFRSSRMGNASVPMTKIQGEWKISGNITTDGPNNGIH